MRKRVLKRVPKKRWKKKRRNAPGRNWGTAKKDHPSINTSDQYYSIRLSIHPSSSSSVALIRVLSHAGAKKIQTTSQHKERNKYEFRFKIHSKNTTKHIKKIIKNPQKSKKITSGQASGPCKGSRRAKMAQKDGRPEIGRVPWDTLGEPKITKQLEKIDAKNR